MRIARNLLLGIVILWGLLVLLTRIATPFLGDYRGEIASLLSDQLGTPVSIDRLQVRWYGVRPLIELEGVTLGSATPLEVDRARLDIDLGTLTTNTLADSLRITLEGLRLTLIREASGQIHFEGLQHGEQPAAQPPALPRHIRLVDTQVTWIDRKTNAPAVTIDRVTMLLDRDGEHLRLRAHLESDTGKADLRANVSGVLTTTDWQADTYLRVDNLDLVKLLAGYLPPTYGIRSFGLDLEAWSEWRNAAPVATQGSFRLRDVSIHPTAGAGQPLDLRKAQADFTLQREQGSVRGGLRNLQLTFPDHSWQSRSLAVAIDGGDEQPRRLRVAADYLRLEDLVRILQVRLPIAALDEPLQRLQPRGEVFDLRIDTELGKPAPQWRARARFAGVSFTAWNKVPGVSRLDGILHAQQDHLVIELDTRASRVHFKSLFRAPLPVDVLAGRIDLLRSSDGWTVHSERLTLNTPHIETATRLRIVKTAAQPLFIDLQSTFANGDGAHASLYYPVDIMSDKLVAWLDRSIVSGTVRSGSALFHGPAHDFPFEKSRSGRFEVVFDAEDAHLAYRDGWPAIENIDATVHFVGNQLHISARDGSIYDSRIVHANGHIQSLKPLPALHLQGQVQGPLHNTLRLLGEPALRGRYGEIASTLRASGNVPFDIDLLLPLKGGHETVLNGRIRFDANTLSVPAWDIAMSDIRGELAITLDGLSARDIQARALGAPVSVDVTAPERGTTRVRTRGRFDITRLDDQLPALAALGASGRAPFTVDVDVPSRAASRRGRHTTLNIRSELQGIAIDLPPPLGKRAEQSAPLLASIPLGTAGATGTLHYKDDVQAIFSTDARRIDVMLGGREARLYDEPGVRIKGELGKVDVLAWRDTLLRLGSQDGDPSLPLDIDLRIGQLLADQVRVRDLELSATRSDARWRGKLVAPNLVGRFIAPPPGAQEPFQVDLTRLKLTIPLGDESVAVPALPDPLLGPDPTALPGIALNIDQLTVNDARLGRLRLDALHADDGLHITRLTLREGILELDAAGHWSRLGQSYETLLSGRVGTANVGDLLVDLGYTRQVEKSAADIAFHLRWPGNPAQYHRATLDGNVGVYMNAGRLVELDPGVTRVVGLLNLNALTRRLRLDFSDIFRKGYSFDEISGNFTLGDGMAHADSLRVSGPSGKIDLKGDADLVARTLDQHVTVVPNLDATLPIAGAIAGGPAAALAVLVAQKVMTKQVDAINRFEYSLSGPWGSPEVKQLDTGGTLSKLLRPLRQQPAESADKPSDGDAAAAQTQDAPVAPSTPTPSATVAPTETAPDSDPEQSAQEPVKSTNPFRKLIDLLKKGESHGADIPGSRN